MFDLRGLMQAHQGQQLDLIEAHINPAFAKVLRTIGYDILYERGQGPYLWDQNGTCYIDCLGGYAVFNLGRNHPVVRDALKQAMDLDLPNLIKMGAYRLSGMLAKQLVEIAPPGLDTVFFTNSGAEGVETAMKYARIATGRDRIVYCDHGFHGLTMGALSVNGNGEFREGFGTMLEPTSIVPFNDLAALERELSKNDVAGFIVEPIQGKGVFIAADGYLRGVRELCNKYGTIFVLDEVQTGYGRTGKMFAWEHWAHEMGDLGGPDVMITAKGLSGGYVPVGAVLSKRWIHNKVFSDMNRSVKHSTTFGQNDLAMAAGLATLHVLRDEKIIENSAAMGQRLRDGLAKMIGKYEMVKEVRGKGLMIALEFGPPKSMMLKAGWTMLHKLDASLFPQAILIPLLIDEHVLAQVAGHHMDVIKLIPPLVMKAEDIDEVVRAFEAVVARCHKFPGPIWEVGKKLSGAALKNATSAGKAEPATV